MPDIFPPDFWSEEKRRMWDKLAPLYVRLLGAGARSGEQQLPAAVRILINWNVFNRDAVDYLRRVKLDWVDGINDVTRDRAVGVITDWIEAGEDMPTLQAKLASLFGNDRARRIAVTEVTRTYADGNQLAWRNSGVVGAKRWMTARDERVCPLCGPLHNTVVGLDDVYIQTPRDIAGADASPQSIQRASGLLRSNGAFVGGPPRHPNCRCWLQPVVDENLFRETIRQGLREGMGSELIDNVKARLEP